MHAGTAISILACIQVQYGKYTYLCTILYRYCTLKTYCTNMHAGTGITILACIQVRYGKHP